MFPPYLTTFRSYSLDISSCLFVISQGRCSEILPDGALKCEVVATFDHLRRCSIDISSYEQVEANFFLFVQLALCSSRLRLGAI
jgi:hypothetical protein